MKRGKVKLKGKTLMYFHSFSKNWIIDSFCEKAESHKTVRNNLSLLLLSLSISD